MSRIITYLSFNGNCSEAMHFYRDCLGGELTLQTVRDSPQAGELPREMEHYIVHAALRKDNMVLMGTDMCDEQLSRGNSVSILLECANDEELKMYYEKLQANARTDHPIRETHSGALFGGLTDKFGNHWLFHCKNDPS